MGLIKLELPEDVAAKLAVPIVGRRDTVGVDGEEGDVDEDEGFGVPKWNIVDEDVEEEGEIVDAAIGAGLAPLLGAEGVSGIPRSFSPMLGTSRISGVACSGNASRNRACVRFHA